MTYTPETRRTLANVTLGSTPAIGTSYADLLSSGAFTLPVGKDIWVFATIGFAHDSNIGSVQALLVDDLGTTIAASGQTSGTNASGLGTITLAGKLTRAAGSVTVKIQAKRNENGPGSATAQSTTSLLVIG